MNALTLNTPWWYALTSLDQFITRALDSARRFLVSFNEAEEHEVEDDSGATRPTREEIEARSRATMAKLFKTGGEPDPDDGNDPDPDPDKNKDGNDDEGDPEKGKDGDDKPEGEGDEIDYEKDDDEVDPRGAADPEVRESIAQRDAKINGRRVKELETELVELRLVETQLKKDLEERDARLAEFDKVVIDPKSTPEYRELNDEMWDDVDTAVAEDLPKSAAGLPDRFSAYMKAYLIASRLPGNERAERIAELKATIVGDLGGFDEPLESLMDDDKIAADSLAKEVLGVIRRNVDRAKGMIKLESELREKSKRGRISVGLREYKRSVDEVESAIRAVGMLDDALVEQNPYAPEAVVSSLVKSNVKMKEKMERAKLDVIEICTGPKPLTDSEFDALEEQGVDIKAFLKERDALFKAKRAKLLPLLVRSLFAAPFTNKSLEAIAKEQRRKKDTDDELDALGELESKRRRVPSSESKKEKIVPATERPLAISKFLRRGDED